MFEFFLGLMIGGFGTVLFVFMTSVDIDCGGYTSMTPEEEEDEREMYLRGED
jgi:hypothetical protein